jgi:cytochrome d ubiquinol oxidase subunit I
MNDFFALLLNPNVLVQFPHTVFAGFTTAAFFVLGISAYHLLRKQHVDFFRRSFQIAAIIGTISIGMVILNGHSQAQHMVETQPMKMAAAEALWNSMDPASFSLLTIGDLSQRRDVFAIRIPDMLSLLAYNQLTGEVKGIYDLQAEYEQTYGPGNYIPPVAVTYWTFRAMVGAGFLMAAMALYALFMTMGEAVPKTPSRMLKLLPWAIALPYLANSTGWLLTEMGRSPWIVFGLMKIEDGISNTVPAGFVLLSLILFTVVYGALMVADIYLLRKFATAGPAEMPDIATKEQGEAMPPLVGAQD